MVVESPPRRHLSPSSSITCVTVSLAVVVLVGLWWAGEKLHSQYKERNRRGRLKPKSQEPTSRKSRGDAGSGSGSGDTKSLASTSPAAAPSSASVHDASTGTSIPLLSPSLAAIDHSPPAQPPSEAPLEFVDVSNEVPRKQMFFGFINLYANVDAEGNEFTATDTTLAQQKYNHSHGRSHSHSVDQPHQPHHQRAGSLNANPPHHNPSLSASALDPASLLATAPANTHGFVADATRTLRLKQTLSKWERRERRRQRHARLVDPNTASPASSVASSSLDSPALSFADESMSSIESGDFSDSDELAAASEESKEVEPVSPTRTRGHTRQQSETSKSISPLKLASSLTNDGERDHWRQPSRGASSRSVPNSHSLD